ncbi:LysR family transcriptional regulator [Cupriavidus sp. USMAA2-4]|uniref:LysR family transcriptional regulator n=1 Tax=Cupriavidus malaysiensis TaxID=367825 RepID=A0ABM6F7U9_9BURK|nr:MULTISPECIES: LysR substrate-binding domain-containing protein [Cupriavidus]AOY92608.1 LysR family transcriptional regulator [Cupriavidus sp. USMAA2-4]AOZ00946.1 LysR family transcriptional regulator [Cupriavidus sp. USMAHM13]AOZ07678.1 LysR family transcriptional regulator [Cupriavidus malaysiensis]
MELRQLRYFVQVVELGSMGQAAQKLGVVTSALSQQISRLESELSTRLLQRTSTGVVPTDAGLAFWRQAQLALRHADDAVRAAQLARLSGHVSVGMAPSTITVLGLPFLQAMRERYPDIRLHLVESLSGNLGAMIGARQLDLAVLFQTAAGQRWSVTPLLTERLFVIARPGLPGLPSTATTRLSALRDLPLILPSSPHGLRSVLNAAFLRSRCQPNVVAEIDGLAMLMDAVRAGLGATVQPGAAVGRVAGEPLAMIGIADRAVHRPNLLVSLSDDELSPAGLAARNTLASVTRELVKAGRWPGATLHKA